MRTSAPDSEPGAPPAVSPRPDVDFDPEIDVAPVVRRPAGRPDLAAALAQADDDLRWMADAKPSEQQAYLKPTTLPRGLVAPTVDMGAVRVREGLDPRRAVTVRLGGGEVERAPKSEPEHDAEREIEPASKSEPQSEPVRSATRTAGERPSWRVLAGLLAVIAAGGLLARVAWQGSNQGTEPSGATATSMASNVPAASSPANAASSDVATMGTAQPEGSSPAASVPAVLSATASAPESSVPPVTTGAAPAVTGVRPSPRATSAPSVDTGAAPKAVAPAVTAPSSAAPTVATATLPFNGSAPSAQPTAVPAPATSPSSSGSAKPVTPLFKIEKE